MLLDNGAKTDMVDDDAPSYASMSGTYHLLRLQ